jgi:hypothetical protein
VGHVKGQNGHRAYRGQEQATDLNTGGHLVGAEGQRGYQATDDGPARPITTVITNPLG